MQTGLDMRNVYEPWQVLSNDTYFQFVERGPYVYKEERQYVNVEFSGTRMSYQTKLKQTFDATLTHSECGTSCTETDNVKMSFFFIKPLYIFA